MRPRIVAFWAILVLLLIGAALPDTPVTRSLWHPMFAAATFDESSYCQSGSSPVNCTITVDAGDAVLALCQSDQGSADPAITDNQGDTFTTITERVSAAPSFRFAYDISVTGGSTQFTCTTGTSFNAITVIEISGHDTGGLNGTAPAVNTNTGTDANNTAFTTSNAGIVVAYMVKSSNATITENHTGTTPATWTLVQEDESWTNVSGATARKNNAAASHEHHWLLGTSSTWYAGAVGLSDGAGGGGGTTTTRGLTRVGK